MTRLAERRRVIAWNAPGYGASAPLAADWPSADDYARALAACSTGSGSTASTCSATRSAR